MLEHRGVAQFGSARALGAWGRRFESCHPDQGRKIVCRKMNEQPIYLVAPPTGKVASFHWVKEWSRYGDYKPIQEDKRKVLKTKGDADTKLSVR